jgi:LacI family transcriptional regulator
VQGDHTQEGGERAFEKLLQLPERPTAVMCSNDMTAMGVMRKSHAEKISIPQDLSLVGFDDIWLTEYMLPPLTTIEMSQTELARIAFHALLQDVQREKPNPKGTEYVLRTNLVLRESTSLNARWSGAARE